jgi:hypothetical protein
MSPSTGTSNGIDETELQRRAEARRGRRLVNGLGLISGPRVIVVASWWGLHRNPFFSRKWRMRQGRGGRSRLTGSETVVDVTISYARAHFIAERTLRNETMDQGCIVCEESSAQSLGFPCDSDRFLWRRKHSLYFSPSILILQFYFHIMIRKS